MLSEKVFFVEDLGDGASLGVGDESVQSHRGDFLDKDRVVSGIGRSFSPAERSMSRDEDTWNVQGIAFGDATNDGQAGVPFIVIANFSRTERLGDGNRSVEIIGVGGAKAGDFALRLSPGGGGTGMGMCDAADAGKGFIKDQVSGYVGRRAEVAFDRLAVEINDDKIFRLHRVVVDAAGLDDHEAVRARNAAGIAEGEKNKTATDEFEIGIQNLFAKSF